MIIRMKTQKLILAIVSTMYLVGCKTEQAEVKSEKRTVITAPAELISLQNVTIGPPNVSRMWQYKIQKMAPENKQVQKGEVIMVFDGQKIKNDLIDRKSKLDSEIKKAENDKLKDESREQDLVLELAEAEMNYEKARRTVEIVDVSRSGIEKKKQAAEFRYQTEKLAQSKQKLIHHAKSIVLNRKVSEGKINSLKSRVNSIHTEIDKLTVKAPKDGLVMYIESWNGEKAAVGETVYMGRSLMQLPSLDQVALKVEFAEPDTAKLHEGQEVNVIFEAYPEMAYKGKIAKLGQAFYPKSANNQKVIFDAQIELGDIRPEVMRPGMKAKIEVPVI